MLPTRKSVPRSSRQSNHTKSHHKETQTAVVWTCLSVIRSNQNHLARSSPSPKSSVQSSSKGFHNTGEWNGSFANQMAVNRDTFPPGRRSAEKYHSFLLIKVQFVFHHPSSNLVTTRPIRKRVHTQLVREHSATVVSAG